MKPERTEPIPMKAGDKRVMVNGEPVQVDFRIISEELYQELSQSSPVESRDAFAMKFLEYASGLAVSNYKSGGNWYLSDGRIVKTADILKQFKSELPIEETKEK